MAAPTGLAAAVDACPAYPWPHDGAQRGQVFMQSDCAACHSMLPYASLREAAQDGLVEAKAAEIVVAEEAQPVARPLHGGAHQPDLTHIAKIQEGLHHNLYSAGGAIAAPGMLADGAAVCQELKKMVLPSPVWLQFLQPYMRTFQAA